MAFGFDSNMVLADLHWLAAEAEPRCLLDAERWANELLFYVPEEWHGRFAEEPVAMQETDSYQRSASTLRIANFGRSLMKIRDFHRAAFFLKKIKDESPLDRYMYYWARYLACEQNRLENEADAIDRRSDFENEDMIELHAEMCSLGDHNPEYFDAFLFYVLGKIRVSLKLREKAKEAFRESILAKRAFWPSWEELVFLVESPEEAEEEDYAQGGHWMFQFFKAEVLYRFQLHKNVLEQYEKISEFGFANMPSLINQAAASLNCMQEHDMALELFKKARKIDPFRVEQMHLFSDSLYVRGLRSELANLAHSFYKTHKFTWETCCIVANYYSLRGDHERAVVFLQRSLKLNPNISSVWTLIGHEFMEQKNNSAACLAYRKAIEADPKDYRGWYGLGQLYDILKMPSYSLYYYQQAHKCKSDDSRMLVALGEIYSRLNRVDDAQKCFLKAFKVGDVEGTALMLLGKLYAKNRNDDQAALVYEKYLNVYGEESMNDVDNFATCCSFLANYYFGKNDLDTASPFAQRCLEYETTKEEGRNILRQISQAHHRQSGLPTEPRGGVTSTPAVGSAELARQLRVDVQAQVTPITPQVTVTSPVLFPASSTEEGEAEMAISSDDEDSESY